MQKTPRLSRVLAASLVAAMFGAAPAQAESGQAATPSTGQGTVAPGAAASGKASGNASAKLSRADREALTDLAMANMAEIATARLALNKSKNPEIRSFAQRMIDDHGKAQAEVQALARAKGVALPSELNVKFKAKSAMLEALNGEIFDRTYIKQSGRTDHQQTHGKLKDNMDDVNDPDVKALVMKIRPVVEQHLLMADEVIAKTGRETTGTSGAPTSR